MYETNGFDKYSHRSTLPPVPEDEVVDGGGSKSYCYGQRGSYERRNSSFGGYEAANRRSWHGDSDFHSESTWPYTQGRHQYQGKEIPYECDDDNFSQGERQVMGRNSSDINNRSIGIPRGMVIAVLLFMLFTIGALIWAVMYTSYLPPPPPPKPQQMVTSPSVPDPAYYCTCKCEDLKLITNMRLYVNSLSSLAPLLDKTFFNKTFFER